MYMSGSPMLDATMMGERCKVMRGTDRQGGNGQVYFRGRPHESPGHPLQFHR